MGLLLQQVSEQFVAESMILLRGGRMEVENVGVKDIVASLVSTVQGMAGEFRQMKDMIKGIKEERGAITRKVWEMGWDGDWAGGEGYCEERSYKCS